MGKFQPFAPTPASRYFPLSYFEIGSHWVPFTDFTAVWERLIGSTASGSAETYQNQTGFSSQFPSVWYRLHVPSAPLVFRQANSLLSREPNCLLIDA